jgi:integrase/recombinase XerD
VKSLVFLFTEYDSRKENRVRTIVFGEVKWKVKRIENERKLLEIFIEDCELRNLREHTIKRTYD